MILPLLYGVPTPISELADRLGVSRRQVERAVEQARVDGLPIAHGRDSISWRMTVVERQSAQKIVATAKPWPACRMTFSAAPESPIEWAMRAKRISSHARRIGGPRLTNSRPSQDVVVCVDTR